MKKTKFFSLIFCALYLMMLFAGCAPAEEAAVSDDRAALIDRTQLQKNDTFTPTEYHQYLAQLTEPAYTYDPEADFQTQRAAIAEKFEEVLQMPEKVMEPTLEIMSEKDGYKGYDTVTFKFESEPGLWIPCTMLIPDGVYGSGEKLPAVICLQGHSSGMHISIGNAYYSGDQASIDGDRDFCIQAVAQGYIAIAMEQRGFGTLQGDIGAKAGSTSCQPMAMQALMLGRTLLGERVFDVSQLVTVLEQFAEVDASKISIMGNSGGGTTSFYAACYDQRIAAVMPSCAFCQNYDSIFSIKHCVCNYAPEMQLNFEMADLSILIAPRPLIIVAGKNDNIFPLEGVVEAFETVQVIYEAAGAANNCKLVVGNGGHQFYADPGWKAFREVTGM